MSKHSVIYISVLFILIWTIRCRADVVLLENGDRLTGKVVSVTDGKMKFKSDIFGELEFSISKVRTFRTDEAVNVQLAGQQPQPRQINEGRGEYINIDGQEAAIADLTAINPPEKQLEPKWHGDITANISLQRGNTEQNAAHARLNAERKKEKESLAVEAAYDFSQQEDSSSGQKETTEDNWLLGAKQKWDMSKRHYIFLEGSYEKDRVAELDRRVIIGAGSGYNWIIRDDFNFSTEIGAAAINEEYEDGTSDDQISIQAGYLLDKKINEKLLFKHGLTYYPSSEDPGDYYLTSYADLRYKLNSKMFLNFRAELEHDSTPSGGSKKTDQKYIAGVGYNF